MSDIDTIKHELLGYFNGLPIYHPLESRQGNPWGDYEFNCTPDNLILGGGAGEHPALVLHDLGGLSASYVLECIDKLTEHFPERFTPPPQSTQDRLWDIASRTQKHLEFCGWSMTNIHHFVENAKSPLHGKPFDEKEESMENWIKNSIGEFILYSLPELNPDYQEIINLDGIKDNWNLGYWYNNFTCPPPNYIKSKAQSLQGSGFQEHGFFRWDYVYPPKEY
ncbi:hypothetical protein LP090_07720 [Moraxella bovis]|uniref:hypothetical protein n=1 Tax=Moraxella bovis TaxID=476 RepID=UPI002227AC17|nr:hypothetical protein [Moraxella bovis]UYZ69474.1 hypothetical protein LP122_05265 [Moraxella bovis]UYZ71845.1 hypothetical protein LP089_05315 [Moraxella bovis]UYZ72241.1 hypothetical protein LP105_07350 [Moraxella bovis]UZA15142.1 hypothetical protein LP102_05260 [Moraxella bovis]UZA26502.1 hypothetical protein LP119_07595 [Moraxella bovis]